MAPSSEANLLHLWRPCHSAQGDLEYRVPLGHLHRSRRRFTAARSQLNMVRTGRDGHHETRVSNNLPERLLVNVYLDSNGSTAHSGPDESQRGHSCRRSHTALRARCRGVRDLLATFPAIHERHLGSLPASHWPAAMRGSSPALARVTIHSPASACYELSLCDSSRRRDIKAWDAPQQLAACSTWRGTSSSWRGSAISSGRASTTG